MSAILRAQTCGSSGGVFRYLGPDQVASCDGDPPSSDTDGRT